MPEMVAPESGALNHTSSVPAVGAGVDVPPEGGGGGGGVTTVFWMLSAITSEREAPLDEIAVAVSLCAPFANFVVSRTHDMPSDTLVSVLSAVPSRKNWT